MPFRSKAQAMKYRIMQLRKTCDKFPSQWEGHDALGKFVYIRYRAGILSIGIDINEEKAISKKLDKEFSFMDDMARYAGSHDGFMSSTDMKILLNNVVDFSSCAFLPDNFEKTYIGEGVCRRYETLLQLESLNPITVKEKMPEGSKPDLEVSADRQRTIDDWTSYSTYDSLEDVLKELGKRNAVNLDSIY